MSSPSDVVREAAQADSKTALETWGPEAFARRIRTKIHGFGAPLPPWEDKAARPTPSAKGIPKSVNIILLGPTGSGKSSLIYTWWRALSGSVTGKEEFLAANMHDRLRVGWNAKDGIDCRRKGHESSSPEAAPSASAGGAGGPGEHDRRAYAAGGVAGAGAGLLFAAPKHGTTALHAFQLQAPDPLRGSAGIAVHDTKGQQFFTEEEERFAEQMLQGKLKEGSSLDKQSFKYWFMLGNFGFFSTASLASAPHVVVLVFDVTLRSFEQMLRQQAASELCQCYRKIVRRAGKQGHEVFAVLTHVDAYSPDEDSDADDDAGEPAQDSEAVEGAKEGETSAAENSKKSNRAEGAAFDRYADMPGIISLWRDGLSKALSGEGAAVLPPHNVFAIRNYHKGSSSQDPVVDLASLECLESIIEAGARYVDMRYQQQQEGCTIA